MCCRIYIVHDEVKDKAFELELSWVGEGTNPPITFVSLLLPLTSLFMWSPACMRRRHIVMVTLKALPYFLCVCLLPVTSGRHELVPKDVRQEAEKYAKVRRGWTETGRGDGWTDRGDGWTQALSCGFFFRTLWRRRTTLTKTTCEHESVLFVCIFICSVSTLRIKS